MSRNLLPISVDNQENLSNNKRPDHHFVNSDTEDTEDYDSDDDSDDDEDDETEDESEFDETDEDENNSRLPLLPQEGSEVRPQIINQDSQGTQILINTNNKRSSKITHKLKILPGTVESISSEFSSNIEGNNDSEGSSLKFVSSTSQTSDGGELTRTKKSSSIKDPSITRKRGKGNEIYSQVSHITDNLAARKDAEKLGKKQRKYLPRVTSYCTAGSYDMKNIIKWIKSCRKTNHTRPKLFDDCLYTPFIYKDWRGDRRVNDNNDFIRLSNKGGEIYVSDKQPDLFIFEYGVIVMWGFTEREEKAFLSDLENYEMEKLAIEDVQIENLNYYITQSYQPRIYNDFITLNDGANYLIKLSISHALAQSVKISLFEELVDNSIEDTQDIPQQIASLGKISMSKEDIMKSIGELFILRININLHGSILDSPEIMWSEPQLEPIYQATRGYLEINQRVNLLNQRLEVISDLLQMLKEQLGQSDEEYLEFIVIVLICVEVLVSVVNIIVDIVADIK
ncbi:hypothetical protein QEN19_003570 [Hanseniaspora menglaensis]